MNCIHCDEKMDRFPRRFEDTLCTRCKAVDERKTQAISVLMLSILVVCLSAGVLFGLMAGVLKLMALFKYVFS